MSSMTADTVAAYIEPNAGNLEAVETEQLLVL